jgi:hypothetical protein
MKGKSSKSLIWFALVSESLYADVTTCTVDWTFDSDAVGAAPACWTCGPGKTTGNYKDWGAAYVDDGRNVPSADRVQMGIMALPSSSRYLYMGFDQGTGTCMSNLFALPVGIATIRWRQAGGADRPSGLYLFKKDGTMLCSPAAQSANSNVFVLTTCQGLNGQDSELVYFFVQDSVHDQWGKVFIDDIMFHDADGAVLTVATTTSEHPKTASVACLSNICSQQMDPDGSCDLTREPSAIYNYTSSQSIAYTLDVVRCCPAASSLAICVTTNCRNVATTDDLAWQFFSLLPSLCGCYTKCPAIAEYTAIASSMETAAQKALTLAGDGQKIALLCGTGGSKCLESAPQCLTLGSGYYPLTTVWDELKSFLPSIKCPTEEENDPVISPVGIAGAHRLSAIHSSLAWFMFFAFGVLMS